MGKTENTDLSAALELLSAEALTEEQARDAFKLLQKASKSDDPLANFYLGTCFDQGVGTRKNLKKAFSYYEAAAKDACAPAPR